MNGNGKEMRREIYIDCNPDFCDGGYSFTTNGRKFVAMETSQMVEFLREKYSSNGYKSMIILRKRNLSEEASDEIDSLKQGIEWTVNRKAQSQLI